MAQKVFSLQKVLSDSDRCSRAFDEVTADFDGESEWCDEDGNLKLHGGVVDCARDIQSLLMLS